MKHDILVEIRVPATAGGFIEWSTWRPEEEGPDGGGVISSNLLEGAWSPAPGRKVELDVASCAAYAMKSTLQYLKTGKVPL